MIFQGSEMESWEMYNFLESILQGLYQHSL